MSDEEIIEGFLEGDARHISTIRGWIEEVLRSRPWGKDISCEDVVSDTMLKLIEILRGERFRFESSLKTFVQRITRFTLIDQVRTRKRVREFTQNPPIANDTPEDPHAILTRKEELVIFARIMGIIDPGCREIWQMIFREELSYEVISKRLGITIGALKTRLARCKQKAIEIKEKII